MMRRKFLALLATMLACGGSLTHAQSTIVIGDFDGLPNNTPDPQGWQIDFGIPAGQGTAASFNFASAATTGTGALSLVSPTNFRWALVLDNSDRPTLGADLLSHPILKMDVTWVAAQWTDSTPADPNDNWAKWEKLSINDNTGWQEVNITNDPANPSFPGSWDSVNWGPTHTRTLTYDTRTDIGGAPMAIDPTGFVQLHLAVNMSNTSFPQGGRFWVDNIRLELVPEPTGAALVAMLGVLPLVRRRFGG
jgi:hypothetical protein